MKPEGKTPLRVPLSPLDPDAALWPLTEEARHYIVDVRRLKAGDPLRVFDASGLEAPATLVVHDGIWSAEATGPLVQGHGGADLTVCYGLPKGEKLDAVLRQLTELGVGRVVLMQTAHSVVRLDAQRAAKKHARWSRIVQEAARQCGRADALHIEGPVPFEEALVRTREIPWRGILHPTVEGEAWSSLTHGGALFIGPEGGFSTQEVDAALADGVTPIHLGPLVLRTETAAVVGAALALDRMGALGRPRAPV
ncbi:MAG: RsmE family RNA methyltransferase [Bradymonadia bacterium]